MSISDATIIGDVDAEILIQEWIERNPHHPGRDDVRIRGEGVPVWALIGYLHAASGDIERVAADYRIARDAVLAAIACYQRNTAIIDARLDANLARPR
jgi:uncharacterized protein (DUF433 family)